MSTRITVKQDGSILAVIHTYSSGAIVRETNGVSVEIDADTARSTDAGHFADPTCQKCGSSFDHRGEYCTDETCPYSDYLQHETFTEG